MAVTAPPNPLQEFYESPGVPLRSGRDRARRQARMLSEMLRGFDRPAVIVDPGCGDGSALAVSAEHTPLPFFSPPPPPSAPRARRAPDRVPHRQRVPLRYRDRSAIPRHAAAAGPARPGLLPVARCRVHPAGTRPEGMIP